MPEKLEELTLKITTWEKQLIAPLWKEGGSLRGSAKKLPRVYQAGDFRTSTSLSPPQRKRINKNLRWQHAASKQLLLGSSTPSKRTKDWLVTHLQAKLRFRESRQNSKCSRSRAKPFPEEAGTLMLQAGVGIGRASLDCSLLQFATAYIGKGNNGGDALVPPLFKNARLAGRDSQQPSERHSQ